MLSTGDIIDGKYRIVRLLGEGGMGAVYEGENTRIHRRVAIKVLHSNVAQQQEAVQRFEREAQAAGRIGSEHIVEVLDLGTLANGDRYLVMEYLEGTSLSSRIKDRGQVTPQELCAIAYQLLEGLAAAHGAGIIHRDLKPDNVYLLKTRGGQQDFVKLLDFGISKFNQLSGDSGFSMTRTGAVMGTPYYMSPEQAKGARDMDHRVDLYATGVILYEALTGQVPFNADTFNELLFKIVLEEPKPLEQLVTDIDPAFVAIVNKAMARDPAHRFSSASDFQQALSQWAAGHGPQLVASLAFSRGPAPAGTGMVSAVNPALGQVAPGLGTMGNAAPSHGSIGTGTPGTWSQSGNYQSGSHNLPKKSNGGLFAGLGVVAVLLLGGGAFAYTSMSKSQASADEAQRAAEAADKEKQEKASAAQRAQAELEKAKAAQAEAEAQTQQAQADKQKLSAEKDALTAAAAAAAASAAPVPRAGARSVAAAPRKTVAPAKEPAQEPAKSGTSTTTSGGRKIRTSL